MSATLYRAAAARRHGDIWRGRWRRTRADAEAQALRWAFELDDRPESVWLERLPADGPPELAAVLLVLGDEEAA